MLTTLSILTSIVCVFLVLFVLAQNSKGGGLTQSFASTQQVMGVKKTTDYLVRVTWTCAIIIMVLSFVSVAVLPKNVSGAASSSVLDEVLSNQQQQTAPAASSTLPGPSATDATPLGEPAPDAGQAAE
ncbi:MAG: preprotein translocase subunit SecG [Bacteroidales bacterium]|nr:preprotein translocase subunit SecG [Bacteroidales bacterium]